MQTKTPNHHDSQEQDHRASLPLPSIQAKYKDVRPEALHQLHTQTLMNNSPHAAQLRGQMAAMANSERYLQLQSQQARVTPLAGNVVQRAGFGDMLSGIGSTLGRWGAQAAEYVSDMFTLNLEGIGDHESYNLEEAEDKHLHDTNYDQWATMHFNAVLNSVQFDGEPIGRSFVSTKGQQRWQFTLTANFRGKDGLLRPRNLRAHVHYYVVSERSWRQNSPPVVTVTKAPGNYWISGIANRSRSTPQSFVAQAPNLPAGWAAQFVNDPRGAYQDLFFSEGEF